MNFDATAPDRRKLKTELEQIVRGWAEGHNGAEIPHPGPPNPLKEHGDEPNVQLISWETQRVDAALLTIGKGVYYPSQLSALLVLLYFKGDPVERFRFLAPGEGFPVWLIGMGFRRESLVDAALARFWKVLRTEVEANPKPPRQKELRAS